MPIELQIIRAREFVRMGAQGELDSKASYQMLAELARACRLRGIDRAMLDVREMHAELTPDDLADLVGAFREMGFTRRQRLAVLHQGDPHRRARTFALIGKLRGWKVQAFDSFEKSMLWLSQDQPEARMAAAQGEPIPIKRVVKAELKKPKTTKRL